MTDFRLRTELPKNQITINHADLFQLWGSCFADNIGKKLTECKFRCDVNPFGTLYNPISIATGIKELIHKKIYSENNLCFGNGQWFSYMHHSLFSSSQKEKCLERINSRLSLSREVLEKANWILFTWGSAWVYRLRSNHQVVGNCHKMPDREFVREKLEVNEIVATYIELLTEIKSINSQVKFMFTVSPIRHAKDGMHGNQLSKATLLLAIDKLCKESKDCYYFPSYELMMDELRDYRFYADDMLHPSEIAINYIWECFSETYFDGNTMKAIESWGKIKKGIEHRPFDVNSTAHQLFLREILLKIEQLKEKMPYLDVENEIKICQAQLKK